MSWVLDLLAWYNLPFLIPLGLVIIYLVIHLIGIDSSGGGAEFGDIAVGIDDESNRNEYSPMLLSRIIKLLNVSDVPLNMLLGVFFISWGIEGVAFNYVLSQAMQDYPPFMLPVSCIVVLVASLVITKVFAGILSLFVPTSQEGSISYGALVGSTAEVILPPRKEIGKARIRGGGLSGVTVYFRAQNGSQLRAGDEIVLLEYDPDDKVFDAEKFDIKSDMSEDDIP